MAAPVKIVVIGHTGFLGQALAAQLDDAFPRSLRFGLSRKPARRPGWETSACDLDDPAAAPRLLKRIAPDWIFHLAGIPVVDRAREMLDGFIRPTTHLLEAAYALPRHPVVVLPGSAAEYGIVARARLPVVETQSPNPVNFYGAAKAAQTAIGKVYAHRGLDVRIARIFNVLGPGLGTYMALSSFVRQVVAIERKLKPPVLETGDLTPKRDFIDAQDAALGLLEVARHGRCGEAYNICSGKSESIASLTKRLLSMARLPIRLRSAPERLRPADIPDMRGATRKAALELGWKSKIPPAESLRAMLEHDRALADLG